MPIESICEGCGRRLRVDDRFAGMQARCPFCRTIYTVPAADMPTAGLDQWQLQSATGDQYGPVSKSELDGWVAEGRVTADSLLRAGGQDRWVTAVTVYPNLAQPPPAGTNPFQTSADSTNPYSPPSQVSVIASRRPHRGGTVLTLGLLGLLCCQILSPVAWALGYSDIKAIDAGRMDPAGRSTTQVGMVLGIVGTVIMVLTFGLQMFLAFFSFMG